MGTVQRFVGFSVEHAALNDVGLYGLRTKKKAQ